MKKLLLPLVLFFILSGCGEKSEWTGFYYPDASNIGDESTWKIQPGFKTLDECRDWVDDIAGKNMNYDYECGKGCRYEKSIQMNVCKETVQ